MAKKKGSEENLCPVCGSEIDPSETKCSRCGTKYKGKGEAPADEGEKPEEGKKGKPEGEEKKEKSKSEVIDELTKIKGVGKATAETLYMTGYTNIDVLKRAEVQDLAKLKGINKDLAKQILDFAKGGGKAGGPSEEPSGEAEPEPKEEGAAEPGEKEEEKEEEEVEEEEAPPEEEGKEGKRPPKGKKEKGKTRVKKGTSGEKSLAKWLEGDEEDLEDWLQEKPEKKGEAKEAEEKGKEAEKVEEKGQKTSLEQDKEHLSSLRQWLTGEAEDALESWLSDESAKPEEEGEVSEKVSAELKRKEKMLQQRAKEIEAREKEMEGLKVEMAELKDKIGAALEQIDTGSFDPLKTLEESASLKRRLDEADKEKKHLKEEIDHVKKGSIAVIKYVKAQQARTQSAAVASIKNKLIKETNNRQQTEIQLKEREEELKVLKEQLDGKIKELPADAQALKQKEMELLEKEKALKAKEESLSVEASTIQQQAEGVAPAGEPTGDAELQYRFEEELREKEESFGKEREEFRTKIAELEHKAEELVLTNKQLEERMAREGKSDAEVNTELQKKAQELELKERSMVLREDEIQRLQEQLRFKDEELSKLREPMKFKEQEMLRREEDLMYREQRLIAEIKRLEEAKKSIGTLDQQEAKKQLEALKQEISRKEEEIRSKDTYLRSKEEELRLREQGLIGEEIEAREEDRQLEISIKKIKSGTSRLDDLLYGGIPFGSNVAIYGPPFVGKEVLVNVFVAEGLKKGIPVIWVLTDKTPAQIREEMMFIVSGYEEYEKLNIVKYIDAYSISMGEEQNDQYTLYLQDPTDHQGILKAVEDVGNEFKKQHEYYRLAFRSVSTLIAYLDPTTAFKFLQPFAGRRRRDKSVAMYLIEKGMHSDADIQMLGHMMDGTIDFKVEQLKTFLSVQGICDVQSRAYVRYTHSKQGLNIGSFSLDHIR